MTFTPPTPPPVQPPRDRRPTEPTHSLRQGHDHHLSATQEIGLIGRAIWAVVSWPIRLVIRVVRR